MTEFEQKALSSHLRNSENMQGKEKPVLENVRTIQKFNYMFSCGLKCLIAFGQTILE